ncbi:hypothetical protein [Methanosarcina horonobensis]|uniref:hypothetical protein n=1 Tax=Methanosarcina horonobensis TaxID=418008 RepID=UPI000AA29EF1|nr:hypothetical protein [Methanosarcina horonobensis]
MLITASKKEMTFELLENYDFDYVNLGSYGNNLLQKLVNIPILDLKMYKEVRGFKPEVFVGLGSIRAAHTSFFIA